MRSEPSPAMRSEPQCQVLRCEASQSEPRCEASQVQRCEASEPNSQKGRRLPNGRTRNGSWGGVGRVVFRSIFWPGPARGWPKASKKKDPERPLPLRPINNGRGGWEATADGFPAGVYTPILSRLGHISGRLPRREGLAFKTIATLIQVSNHLSCKNSAAYAPIPPGIVAELG